MPQPGKNGTVTKCGSGPSGTVAEVAFPQDPGPPIVPAHIEVYDDLPANVYLCLLVASMTAGAKVDCTVDAAGKCDGAMGHR